MEELLARARAADADVARIREGASTGGRCGPVPYQRDRRHVSGGPDAEETGDRRSTRGLNAGGRVDAAGAVRNAPRCAHRPGRCATCSPTPTPSVPGLALAQVLERGGKSVEVSFAAPAVLPDSLRTLPGAHLLVAPDAHRPRRRPGGHCRHSQRQPARCAAAVRRVGTAGAGDRPPRLQSCCSARRIMLTSKRIRPQCWWPNCSSLGRADRPARSRTACTPG